MKFNSIIIQSNNKISEQEVFLLLQDTLNRLSQTRLLNEAEQNLNLGISK